MTAPVTLVIPAPCEWINSNDRTHYQTRAKLTKAWRTAAYIASRNARIPPFTTPVHVLAHIQKPRGGRWDPANWYPTAKACVDGLVDAGILEDDDHTRVQGPDMRRAGKGPNQLTLTILAITPDTGDMP